MQVTFASGLEGLGQKVLAKKAAAKDRAGETLFQQYLRRGAEKRKALRAARRGGAAGSSASDSEHDGIDVEDRVAAGHSGGDRAKQRGARQTGPEKRAQAEGADGQGFFADGDGAHAAAGATAAFDDDFFQVWSLSWAYAAAALRLW